MHGLCGGPRASSSIERRAETLAPSFQAQTVHYAAPGIRPSNVEMFDTESRAREDERHSARHMNQALHRLAAEVDLASDANERIRLQFGLACVERVKHFIEDDEVLICFEGLRSYVEGGHDRATLSNMAQAAYGLANHHRGSRTIDGCGHAAVSATYAVANALAGKALEAADYAAYASVYGQGGYGAVSDAESFLPEHEWQVARLASFMGR